MYEIILESKAIGVCDKPNYVKNKDGVWINCPVGQAEAIALNGEAHKGAYAREIDGGEYLLDTKAGLEWELTELDILSMQQEQAITENEIAIMELSERLEG